MNITDLIQDATDLCYDAIANEYIAQGHNNTGKSLASFETDVIQDGSKTIGLLFVPNHVVILNEGVSPQRIPYSPGSGRGQSKYINGLIEYFKTKGLSDKEAKGAAFATAKKHKQEGLSTKSSSKYSSTGKRQNFIEEAIKGIESELESLLINKTEDLLFSITFG